MAGGKLPKVKSPAEMKMEMAVGRARAPQEPVLSTAGKNALKLGQSDNRQTRSLQQGYEHGWYHGGTGDITSFDPKLLGESTGAASAKQGFFFARDPQNPPEHLTKKTDDPKSIEMLRRAGVDVDNLNKVSFEGHGADTASGYARMGGDREYKEAMRKAKAAEKRGDWSAYEKHMAEAEDYEVGRMNEAQLSVAKYGEARDTMLDRIGQAFYRPMEGKNQFELEAFDKEYQQLFPYGWYSKASPEDFKRYKELAVARLGEEGAAPVLDAMKDFESARNERTFYENLQSGANVMPVALRYKDPLVHDFAGSTYRDETYNDLLRRAREEGKDAVLLKNTYDPGAGPSKLVDVGVVFDPSQVRSRFAAFDPEQIDSPDILKAKGGAVKMAEGGAVNMRDGGDPDREFLERMREEFSVYNKPTYGNEIPGTPSIDQQRYELSMRGRQEAENRERTKRDNLTAIDPSGTLGIVDALKTVGKSIVAPIAYVGGNAFDWLQTGKVDPAKSKARGEKLENWMQPKTEEGGEILQTIGEIPAKLTGSEYGFGMHPNLWVSGVGMTTPKQAGAGLRLGAEKYGTPLAEKGLSLLESGRDPMSVLNTRMTGMQGNPAFTDIFAGSKSKTADLAARDIAQARLNAGDDPALVWKETGWAAPPYGGELRYEISDTGLTGKGAESQVTKKIEKYGKNLEDLRSAYEIKVGLAQDKTLDEILANWKLKNPPSENAIKLGLDDTIGGGVIAGKFNKEAKKSLETYGKVSGKLGKMIEHPDFFDAYPDAANLIKFETLGKKGSRGVAGEFSPHDKALRLNIGTLLNDPRSTTTHELQHFVQNREGNSPGGSPSWVKSSPEQFDPITAEALLSLQERVKNDTGRLGELHQKANLVGLNRAEQKEIVDLSAQLPEHRDFIQAREDFLSQGSPTELYRRLAGEAEARLAQHRRDLTPEQRRELYPYDPEYFKKTTGFTLDDIVNNIVRPNSSISSQSAEPSVAQMKAELKEKKLAPANEIGFYSPTEAAALNLQRKSGQGQAFLNDIMKGENVRADEISAMGLDTFLKGKKNVTADEVRDYIAKNKIQLGETRYGKLNDQQMMAEWNKIAMKDYGKPYNELDHNEAVAVERYAEQDTSKFSDYALPGGENYREIVLTLPSNRPSLKNMSRSEYNAAVDAADKTGITDYKSSHWDEPNPLSHLRVSDRLTDGKKTLLVDEVQSDWHQAGREHGYSNPEQRSEIVRMLADEIELTPEQEQLRRAYLKGKLVPEAPYKDDWYQLTLRRAIKEAIDGGYDRVALPTGSRVAERFDLSKQIDRIDYSKNEDGTYSMSAIKNGREVFAKEDLDENELSGIVGKDVARKIVRDEGKPPKSKADRWESEDGDEPEFKSLSGLDLSVGGEGMKKYYDEIYPNYLKKFGKKYGAKVGQTETQLPYKYSNEELTQLFDSEGRLGESYTDFVYRVRDQGKPEPLYYMEITPAMRKEFSTGIHMKSGGKVSFAKSLDAMRHELTKAK